MNYIQKLKGGDDAKVSAIRRFSCAMLVVLILAAQRSGKWFGIANYKSIALL